MHTVYGIYNNIYSRVLYRLKVYMLESNIEYSRTNMEFLSIHEMKK